MKKTLTILGVVAVVAALIFLSYKIGQKKGKNSQFNEVEIITDTIIITDTFVAYTPRFVRYEVIDTQFVQVRDTIRINDTLYMSMEREQVVWEDSLARIYASGITPKVDSVYHYMPTQIINNTIVPKDKRWGIGIQVGAGASKQGLSPYLGIGLSYNLLVF